MPNKTLIWKQKRRQRPWEQQRGKCYWCGEDVIKGSPPSGKRVNPKLATLDHLRSRFDPARLEPNYTCEQRLVLACYECNQRRGREAFRAHFNLDATPEVVCS